MSLISCDHQITLSPRRDVSRKRLRPRRNYTKHGSCFLHIIIVILQQLQFIEYGNALIDDAIIFDGNSSLNGGDSGSIPDGSSSGTVVSSIGGGHYLDKLDKLDKLERSVAAVLIKVAYGTTSTTKRSIPDNSYVPSLTTIATPPLTTFRYLEKTQHQQIINLHHRNYELDLERDHALPTSAPNADILKSNSNPTYPNPNRHHNHDRDRHRHLLNSTPAPSMHNLLKKGQPTIPMYPGDMPSYSPPARSFFTPPLPPEYQNPFADKPTLRGTNNDAGVVNTGTYINRRPIPPPSLMPGHERIPFRPPDLNSSTGSGIGGSGGGGGGGVGEGGGPGSGGIVEPNNNNNRRVNNVGPSSQGVPTNIGTNIGSAKPYNEDVQRKKALNTPSQKVNSKVDNFNGSNMSSLAGGSVNSNETTANSGRPHFSSISRILSSSNGRKEEVPEVLLRKVTDSPNFHPPSSPVKQSSYSPSFSEGSKNPNINQNKNLKDDDILSNTEAVNTVGSGGISNNDKKPSEQDGGNRGLEQSDSDEDDFDMFVEAMNPNSDQDEPKTQPKIKMNTKSTEYPNNEDGSVYSTQIIHNLANINNEKSLLTTSTPSGAVIGSSGSNNGGMGNGINGNSKESQDNNNNNNNSKNGVATWAVAWNIHVYLSAILFTILAVYSIFKMIFYDKLTHLFNQSYFICIHLVLIMICMTRIFYLCYDAYNIHSSFHLFVSEILLNLPATFLTISFSVLILFLLIRSLNHKNNRYSALIRPLTVVVGSSVHVGLCVTLHYVESYTTSHSHLYYQHQQQQQQHQMYRNGYRGSNIGTIAGYNHQLPPPPPPRVLSLICQIIYIFVCLSLGLLYLYIYRVLKRVLRSKSQNYIHGYQNLSYAIHITIATALLFVLLAALQIYGAISISTTRPLITSSSEIDWLQWGYQFSLRLIEIAIITLMSWVAGLKTGGTSGVLQREKAADTHNVSGFALFPCTSSSSQEHFETDYPAVCNANTNLHTYTLRTGKPIYDDNFALNSLGSGSAQGQVVNSSGQRITSNNDFQLQNSSDFVRSYETSSLRSTSAAGAGVGGGGGGGSSGIHHHHHHHHQNQMIDNGSGHHSDFLTDPQTDHYENPNFELRPTKQDNLRIDNCYSEPLNSHGHHMIGGLGNSSVNQSAGNGYDFQNFERPVFSSERPTSRNDLHASKSIKQLKSTGNHLDRSNYENPERRSSNSTHSCTSGRNYPSYNSFERRSGVRKSGTLNNIGGVMHGRNGSSSSSSSSSRPSGVQTLSSTHNRPQVVAVNNNTGGCNTIINSQGSGRIINTATASGKQFYRDRNNHRSSLERSSSAAMQQYMLPSDDDIANPERANLITNGSGSGITSSTSGGNLTDACNQHNVVGGVGIVVGGGSGGGGACGGAASSSSGESANSGSMLVAEHGFVRFRALDDINNAQGVGIHNASIRTTGRSKEKRYTNNT